MSITSHGLEYRLEEVPFGRSKVLGERRWRDSKAIGNLFASGLSWPIEEPGEEGSFEYGALLLRELILEYRVRIRFIEVVSRDRLLSPENGPRAVFFDEFDDLAFIASRRELDDELKLPVVDGGRCHMAAVSRNGQY